MTNKCRYDQDQGSKYDQNTIDAEMGHSLRDGFRNSVQEPRRRYSFPETQSASCENDDCPEEIVEVFLCQDACTEEEYQRNNGDDAHIAENTFQLVAGAPQSDRCHRGDDYKVLDAVQFVCHGSNRHNRGSTTGLKRNE